MRAKRHRLRKHVRSLGLRRLERRLAVGDAVRIAREQLDDLPFVEPRRACGAQRDQERLRLRAVRIVGRVEDLLGRDEAEEAQQVDRAPHGRVEEHARRTGEVTGEPGEIGDAGVRDDQLRVRVRVDEACEVVGDRRQAAATVDEDRHAPLGRDREDRCEPLVVEHELLRARVELDAARAEVEAALGLLDR